MLADAALVDDAVEIFEDRRAVGDRLFVPPRFEDETQRVHVAVRPDAGVAEQIPGAAQIGPPLDQREAAVGTMHLEMRGHADARKAGADDQNVLIHGAVHACHHFVSHLSLRSQLTHSVAFCNRIDVYGKGIAANAPLPLSQYCHRGVIEWQ